MLSDEPWLVLIGDTLANLFLISTIMDSGTVTTTSSPCVILAILLPVMERILRSPLQFVLPLLEMVLPIVFPKLAATRVPHMLSSTIQFPPVFLLRPSIGKRTRASL